MDFSQAFKGYMGYYAKRAYDASRVQNEYELEQIDYSALNEDCAGFNMVCTSNADWAQPPQETKYLWVIMDDGARVVAEFGRQPMPKHTNITGGDDAYCGGEIWFISGNEIMINGASGRYMPRDARELSEIEEGFRHFGYVVDSFGWDEETERPHRTKKI